MIAIGYADGFKRDPECEVIVNPHEMLQIVSPCSM
jgi:alanine racemase